MSRDSSVSHDDSGTYHGEKAPVVILALNNKTNSNPQNSVHM
jgi:hypothetical protein